MRKQSFHSSVICYTKGSSIDTPSFETLDSASLKPVSKVKPVKVAKRVGVTTIVMGKLEQYRKPEQKYYNLIKLIADPYFLVACYEEIAKKKGNKPPGSDGYTIEGLNWEWFVKTSESLKSGIFVFQPNRRLEIPKANGKTRPLGISDPRGKIVQKALHAVLEAIFEPKFLSSSHGLRPKKSVHSALLRVYLIGQKHNWVIQGEITKCFDQIPHGIIMNRIKKYVADPRFLEILNKFLKAGYFDPKTGKLVLSNIGTPQEFFLSSLLANIVLHELDKYMFKYETSFNKGLKRIINPEYKSLASKRSRATDPIKRRSLLNQMRNLRRSLIADPDFRRMEYIRYADDFVVFVSGSLKDAKFIQSNIKDVLKTNCGLELNQEKTIISNLSKEKLSFLGAEVKKLRHNPQLLPVLLDQSQQQR
jgi:group II intron reverse transcriptase/maturase